MFYWKIGLLRSRSRSQWRFKISVNIFPNDIFSTAKHFVTKVGMVIQLHEPEGHVDFCFVLVAIFKGKVTSQADMIKIWLFLLYFLNCRLLGYQTWSDVASSEAQVSCEKLVLLHTRSRSQRRVIMSMFVQMIFFLTTKHFVSKLGIVMHHHESECHAKRLVCCFQGQGHRKGSYDQNITISTVSS